MHGQQKSIFSWCSHTSTSSANSKSLVTTKTNIWMLTDCKKWKMNNAESDNAMQMSVIVTNHVNSRTREIRNPSHKTQYRMLHLWHEPDATVLFPCGVGRVASRLLSKFVGLYHKVIYVEGLWKVHDRLRLADTLTHTQFSVISLILFVNCNVFYKNKLWFLFNPYPTNVENRVSS